MLTPDFPADVITRVDIRGWSRLKSGKGPQWKTVCQNALYPRINHLVSNGAGTGGELTSQTQSCLCVGALLFKSIFISRQNELISRMF